MFKRIGVSLLMLALAGSACAKKDDAGTKGEGKKGTYTVQVDATKEGAEINFFALRYFPKELSVHPGDTVDFKLNWNGEPHSVTFGTLVDAGIAKVDPKADEEPAELKKIPGMLPEGPGDANPVSVNPCFVATGDPSVATCKKEQPKFDGKYAMYSSGFIAPESTFTVPLAKDVAPGTYNWFCTLHRTDMAGKLTVVAATATVKTPAAVLKEGDAAIQAELDKLKPAYAQAVKGVGPGVAAGLGVGPDAGIVAEFLPKTVKIKVGQAVRWGVTGPHTVAFNAPQDAVDLMTKAPDGTWHVNPKNLGPAGSPPAAPSKETGNVVDAGTWNGEGFLNSGFLPGFGPPGYLTWQIKFGKAGSYKYACLIHPDMEGIVEVA